MCASVRSSHILTLIAQMPLNELRIETAKSELAVSTADSASTMSDAAETSFVNQALKGVPQSYQRDLLAKCGVCTCA